MAKFDLSKGRIRTSKATGKGKQPGAKERASDAAGQGSDPAGRASDASAGVPDANTEISMSVSSVCGDEGERFAFVHFEDGARYCEYRFPKVELKVNNGFSEDELVQLKFYVATHIPELKKMAATVDPFHALYNG